MKSVFLSLTKMPSLIVMCTASTLSHPSKQVRAADTCADPSLAVVYIEAFSPSIKAHTVDPRTAFVAADTTRDWQFQSEAFLAWTTQQPFTTPLYRLLTQVNQDYMFLATADGTPPSIPGYTLNGVVGYVYATQVCGSVPLYTVSNAAAGDHFYTTITSERDDLIARGWADAGIAAYVLPLSSNCTCSG